MGGSGCCPEPRLNIYTEAGINAEATPEDYELIIHAVNNIERLEAVNLELLEALKAIHVFDTHEVRAMVKEAIEKAEAKP